MDAIDSAIIGCVLRDGRATNAVIGAHAGLSASAAKRRLDRLIHDGAIRGFTAVVDPDALGWNTEAFVMVYCKGTVAPADLRTGWADVPEIVSASTVTGSADAIVKMQARDVTQLEQAIGRLRKDRRTERTESMIVLSRLIERAR